MAKVKFKRKTESEIKNLPIDDGSIIFDVTNKNILMDYGINRDNYSNSSKSEYILPIANQNTLGGVKAKPKTNETTEVAIDTNGKLFIPDISNLITKEDLNKKLNKNQGSQNNGKILGIDETGNIIPVNQSFSDVNYNSLTNKPQINGHELNGNQTSKQLELASIADIKTKTSELINDSGFLTEHQDISQLATKDELNNKLNKNQGIENKGKILSVDSQGEIIFIEKPTEGGGTGGTSDYIDLINKPKINNIELNGNVTLETLKIQPKGDYALSTEIPTKVSQLQNDKNYLTEHQNISGKLDKNQGSQNNGKILGIDAQGNIIPVVKSSSGTTDYTALINKPKINGIELNGNKALRDLGIQPEGSYALKTDIKTKLSELNNDVNFQTLTQVQNLIKQSASNNKIYWNE